MPRQIAIFASATDEDKFLAWLRTTAPIQIFQRVAGSEDELWVDAFAPYQSATRVYYLWNRDFAWEPTIREGELDRNHGEPWFHIELPAQAPVIEFARTDMRTLLETGVHGFHEWGRLYWAQRNRQKGFQKWYESIVRWVRKNGVNLFPGFSRACYCLPDAYQQMQTRGCESV